MTKGNGRVARGVAKSKAQEIVEGLRELTEALKAGEPLESRFTVRTYRIAPPPGYGAADVRRARDGLAMSQAAFAAFLGVDASTVRSWEQGLRAPSPLACRMLSEIEASPAHWRRRLSACLVGPEVRGPMAGAGTPPRRRRRAGTTEKSGGSAHSGRGTNLTPPMARRGRS